MGVLRRQIDRPVPFEIKNGVESRCLPTALALTLMGGDFGRSRWQLANEATPVFHQCGSDVVDKGPPQKADTPTDGRRGRFGPRRDSRIAKCFDDDLSEELFNPQIKILVEHSL
jgi:hypothetical protein